MSIMTKGIPQLPPWSSHLSMLDQGIHKGNWSRILRECSMKIRYHKVEERKRAVSSYFPGQVDDLS